MVSILAVETATEACSAALYHEGQLLSRFCVAPQQHARLILPFCEALLAQANLQPSQLSAVAFGRGPGSFTGVRIAAAVVQGIAVAHDLPVIAVSTLQALAQAAFQQTGIQKIIAGIDARMHEIYAAKFIWQAASQTMGLVAQEMLIPQAEISSLAFAEEKDWFYAGSGFQKEAVIFPSAEALMPVALRHWQENKIFSPEMALPVYLRDNVAF